MAYNMDVTSGDINTLWISYLSFEKIIVINYLLFIYYEQ